MCPLNVSKTEMYIYRKVVLKFCKSEQTVSEGAKMFGVAVRSSAALRLSANKSLSFASECSLRVFPAGTFSRISDRFHCSVDSWLLPHIHLNLN